MTNHIKPNLLCSKFQEKIVTTHGDTSKNITKTVGFRHFTSMPLYYLLGFESVISKLTARSDFSAVNVPSRIWRYLINCTAIRCLGVYLLNSHRLDTAVKLTGGRCFHLINGRYLTNRKSTQLNRLVDAVNSFHCLTLDKLYI